MGIVVGNADVCVDNYVHFVNNSREQANITYLLIRI